MAESNITEDKFIAEHSDFSLREQVVYPNGGTSRFYDNGVDMVIIDNNICNQNEHQAVFSYMLITDKQNNYMHRFKRVFRFLGYIQEEVDKYLFKDEMNMTSKFDVNVADRAEKAKDMPEIP